MTMKFEIPFPISLTDEQFARIKDDIHKRTKALNQITKTTYELDTYTISILVVLKEVSK